MLRSAALFLGKCVAFVAVFWVSYFLMVSPLRGQSESTSQAESNEQRAASQQAMQKYSDQLKKSEQMLAKQDDLLDRWEKVIEHWEAISRNAGR